MSRIKMICMSVTMLALSVGCFAQSPRVIAQKLYDQIDQAEADQDSNRLFRFFDSNFVATDEHGKRVAFAEFRRNVERNFRLTRSFKPSTSLQDVRLEGDRMVVFYNGEVHYEYHHREGEWVPQILKISGEDAWERKGDQWKLVRGITYRADNRVDPEYQKAVDQLLIDAARAPCSAADEAAGRCR